MTLLSARATSRDDRVRSPLGDRTRFALSRFRAGPAAVFWAVIVAILVLPILLFLLVAFSPRLLDQGDQWFTLSAFSSALTGQFLQGMANSLMVGACAAVLATAAGGAVAWAVLRTDIPGRRLWSGSMFALLLAPSYLLALGWERLLEPAGVFDLYGIPATWLRGLFYGPFGVVVVLTVKGLPFAYLALSNALRGLGEEFEAAARVHGGGRIAAGRIVVALLAPACWSALAIVFAESVSDFGVASTLANDSHFTVATYTLYNAVNNFPVQFPIAAAVGWVLLAMAGVALIAQNRALRGRTYRVLGGRSRPARRQHLGLRAKAASVAGLSALVVVCLGVPIVGAVSASMIKGLGSLGVTQSLTFANYSRVLHSPDLLGPLLFSARLATVTATATVLLGLPAARMMSSASGRFTGRLLDLLLLTAVALPGIVFAAGYIFTYNLPLMNTLGIHLYQTPYLLLLGYLATALPSTARVLLGTVSQVHGSLRDAGRVHGSGALASWLRTTLPLLARPLLAAWVLTFCGTLLELPVSQLLYPPGQPPVSVGISHALSNYDFGGGTAMEVLAILFALAVVGVAWAAFRLLAPAGWQQLGRSR